MKRTLYLFIGLFAVGTNNVFALGGDAFPSIIGSSQDAWKYDFALYGRVLGSAGVGIDKGAAFGVGKKTGYGGSLRIRPAFYATNGNFVFGFRLGTDIYLGKTGLTSNNGSDHFGYGVSGNTVAIQIRNLYLGYLWDSGAYTSWGIQDMTIPYFNADPAAGMIAGWKNKNYDISLFYYQLEEGSIYTLKDGGSLFGIKAELAPMDGLHITPFVMGLAQGYRLGGYDTSSGTTADSINYSDGAKFQGHVGMYAGLSLNYTSPFGLFVNLNAIYLYGKNDPFQKAGDASSGHYQQTRNAAGGMLAIGYSLEEMLKAELFFDIRSGSSKDAQSDGSNHSFNGGIIEYDATQPPLLILYNFGDGRGNIQYSRYFSDGYAFTDRGATTVGVDATFTLGEFDVTISLGYAWYSAARNGNDSNIGFEADLMASYKMMKGTSLYVQAGVLAPGQGLKEESAAQKGAPLRSQMPWLINFGMKYSI